MAPPDDLNAPLGQTRPKPRSGIGAPQILAAVLAMSGAVVAGWLGPKLGWYGSNQGAGFLAAIVGAIIILVVYRAIAGRRF